MLGSRERADLAVGLRTLHLRACHHYVSPTIRRIASPRHFVVYRKVGDVAQVVRLLHDAMNPPQQHIDCPLESLTPKSPRVQTPGSEKHSVTSENGPESPPKAFTIQTEGPQLAG